ncbi:hypothetical protein [Microbispora triticiradicis]|uniref:Uncharacterized protein n=2 Tax=Microbispora TaxID=2005 RepID=A0ABY3LNY8_9ACTN|nr:MULTISPECIES: hypothetical protein [Microbispora]TLP60798.1 hypothetical protein FED44_13095 [Microbispora fusca]TYB45194.1 hypothetical protein FXF59_31710 [Microbispora tritici]
MVELLGAVVSLAAVAVLALGALVTIAVVTLVALGVLAASTGRENYGRVPPVPAGEGSGEPARGAVSRDGAASGAERGAERGTTSGAVRGANSAASGAVRGAKGGAAVREHRVRASAASVRGA